MPDAMYWKALDAFVAREGHAAVPTAHVEFLDGAPLALGRWASRQRRLWRQSRIDPIVERRLAGLPGWSWARRPTGPQRDAARVTEMRALRAAGLSLTQIGERYGISRQRAHQLLAEPR